VHGEFDHFMVVTGGVQLEVCGPLDFDGDPALYDQPVDLIEILAVFVFQPAEGTYGWLIMADLPNPADLQFQRGANEWEGFVDEVHGLPWVAGPAMAMAVVRLTPKRRANRIFFERWCQTIKLYAPGSHRD
jgi:hypothetical protein